ncbi:hypothetical protein, partial [Mesorhizobium sp. M7A.F.Ca.CA.002.05.1.1]
SGPSAVRKPIARHDFEFTKPCESLPQGKLHRRHFIEDQVSEINIDILIIADRCRYISACNLLPHGNGCRGNPVGPVLN